MEEWENIEYLSTTDFNEYIDTLDENNKSIELELYGKYCSIKLLHNEMMKYNSFYKFIKDYSPCDFKIIRSKQYVSQRVIIQHVQLWNDLHSLKIKRLRIFFH